jgi:hypothetical protein
LLGLWAAEKLGFTGDAALAYATDVVAADFEEVGDGDVVRKVLADLRAKDAALMPCLVARHLSRAPPWATFGYRDR